MFRKLSPGAPCAFCREMTTASATGTDRDDRTLSIAAGSIPARMPTTPAITRGASAAIALGTVRNCRCDGSNRG